jgi:ferredoxin
MKLLILYFSGTGNTEYVAHYVASRLGQNLPADGLEIELRSIEKGPAEQVTSHDLLLVGFPVYACEAPELVQQYIVRLPPGDERGAFVLCTKGAYAGGAVVRNLQRLAARGYTPLGGGSVLMPGTDGLALISKDSRLARKALEKDYDQLRDADRLIGQIDAALSQLLTGRRIDSLRPSLPPGLRRAPSDRLWAFLYEAASKWMRPRLHADPRCEGCGLCAQICPVQNVELQGGHPRFGEHCALCMRCIHACPQEAIQIGKVTVDKFRWKGPKGDFRPLRLRPN